MIKTIIIIILILFILNNIKTNETFNNMKYGQIQYDVKNDDNDNVTYKYQNLIENKKYDINKDELIKYNIPKNTITNLPCQQDIIYDTKFFQPSNIYNPVDFDKIDYKERKIQDVYKEIVDKNNIIKQDKKKSNILSEFTKGASGLKSYNNVDWTYDDDDDEMAYDPRTSNYVAY